MTDTRAWPKDPLVDGVRERRRDLLAQFEGDIEKLFEALKARQAEDPGRVVDLRRRRRSKVR